jgi:hypothetical protein
MGLVYYESPRLGEERFSFFILPKDEDGVEDLSDLYLYHDLAGLSWRLSAGDWVAYESEGQTWIGSRSIAMLDGETLPRGQFRAVLVDKGGERGERLFAFDAPDEPRYPFPSLRYTAETRRYRIESQYPRHYFICYDDAGNYLGTEPVAALEGSTGDLNLPSGTRLAALWAEDPERSVSALTNLVSLR